MCDSNLIYNREKENERYDQLDWWHHHFPLAPPFLGQADDRRQSSQACSESKLQICFKNHFTKKDNYRQNRVLCYR